MKFILKTLIALAVVLVLAGLIGFFYLNAIAKKAIEVGGTRALGVPTQLDDIQIGLFGGTVALNGFQIDNPEGFDAPKFVTLADASTGITWSTLRQDVIEIPALKLSGFTMSLEKKDGKANYDILLENLARFSGTDKDGEDPAEPPADADADKKPAKKLVIRELLIEDITVLVDLLPVGGELTRTEVKIPEIKMENIGSDGEGVKVGQLVGIIIKAVLTAVVKKGVDLPLALLEDLGGQLNNLGDFGVKALGQTAEVIGDGVGKAAEGVGKAAEKAGQAVDKLGQGLGNLLGGGKKTDDSKEETEPEAPTATE